MTGQIWLHYFKTISDFKLQLQSGNDQFCSKLANFCSYDLETWSRWLTLTNNRAPLLWFFKLCASFDNHRWIQTWVTVWKRPIWVKIEYFCVVSPWNLWMTLNNNRALLLWYFKLCASFHNNRWIETWVTDHKRPIWVKIRYFLPQMNLKLDRSTWTLGHFIYATSRSEHHFITNQTRVTVGNCKFGSKSVIFFFLLYMTLKFGDWPWRTIGHLFYATSSFVHHFITIGEFKLKIQSRTPHLGKKSAIFLCWVTLNKANLRDLIAATGLVILLKLDSNRGFFARVTLKFDGWLRKIIRHVFYTTSSCV